MKRQRKSYADYRLYRGKASDYINSIDVIKPGDYVAVCPQGYKTIKAIFKIKKIVIGLLLKYGRPLSLEW